MLCHSARRKQLPDKEAKARRKAGQQPTYEVSMKGLAEFKEDLDLIATNCTKYWSKELDLAKAQADAAGQIEAQEILPFLEDAEAFQKRVEELYTQEYCKPLTHLAQFL